MHIYLKCYWLSIWKWNFAPWCNNYLSERLESNFAGNSKTNGSPNPTVLWFTEYIYRDNCSLGLFLAVCLVPESPDVVVRGRWPLLSTCRCHFKCWGMCGILQGVRLKLSLQAPARAGEWNQLPVFPFQCLLPQEAGMLPPPQFQSLTLVFVTHPPCKGNEYLTPCPRPCKKENICICLLSIPG